MAEKAAPKKRTARKKTATVTRARKAPTKKPHAIERTGLPSSAKFGIAFGIAFVVISGISFTIGTSDTGAIDVNGVINERAAVEASKGNAAESEALRNIGKQTSAQNISNGGLVGAGNRNTRQQEIEAEEVKEKELLQASSTDETASSTENQATTPDANEESDATELTEGESELEASEEPKETGEEAPTATE